jgi:hypothetical protein
MDNDSEQIRITKVPLKSLVKNGEILYKINDIVNKSNNIVIHTYMFIKLYFLYCTNKDITLPKLDLIFVRKCIDVVCNNKKVGELKFKNNKNLTEKKIILRNKKIKNQELKLELHKFFVEHFYPLTKYNKIDICNFRDITDYLVKTIITVFETNIKENYFNYVARYINVKLKKKETINNIKANNKLSDDEKKIEIRKFCKCLNDIKYNFIDVSREKFEINEKYVSVDMIRKLFSVAINYKDKYEKDSIHYDLKCNPQEYFLNMINMMKEIEGSGEKILNVFPLRSDVIPKFTTIDTTAIIKVLVDSSMKMGCKENLTKSISPKNNKATHKENKDKIWNKFFNIDSKYFKRKGYEFRNIIQTDGVTCNIYFTKIENNVEKIKKKVKKKNKTNKKTQNISTGKVYLEDYDDKLKYKKYKIVGIDPGVNNIISCVDDTNKEANKFRYSRIQRMKEIGTKKFRRTINSIKTHYKDNKNTDIIGLESGLSEISKKTLDFDKFKSYIKLKCETNDKLKEFYNLVVHRKNRFRSYQNTKKSEQVMLNNFSKKFGSPDNTIICIGDYKRSGHMKYKEPTKGIGMRKLFIDRGYNLFLIDEFRTSCICSKCRCEEGRCVNTIKRPDPRPWINRPPKKNDELIPEENDPPKPKENDDLNPKENDKLKTEEKEEKIVSRLVHGLLCCKNIKCKSYWNRDINGATNILRIAKSIMKNKKRPKELRRTKINPCTIDTTVLMNDDGL